MARDRFMARLTGKAREKKVHFETETWSSLKSCGSLSQSRFERHCNARYSGIYEMCASFFSPFLVRRICSQLSKPWCIRRCCSPKLIGSPPSKCCGRWICSSLTRNGSCSETKEVCYTSSSMRLYWKFSKVTSDSDGGKKGCEWRSSRHFVSSHNWIGPIPF